MVRFGAVFKYCKSYGAVRRGSPLNIVFDGAAPLPVGKTVQHRFLSTVHRMINRTKLLFRTVLALFPGARPKPPFFYCFSTVHRINKPYKPAGAYGFLSFCCFQAKPSATTVTGALKNRCNTSIRTYISVKKG